MLTPASVVCLAGSRPSTFENVRHRRLVSLAVLRATARGRSLSSAPRCCVLVSSFLSFRLSFRLLLSLSWLLASSFCLVFLCVFSFASSLPVLYFFKCPPALSGTWPLSSPLLMYSFGPSFDFSGGVLSPRLDSLFVPFSLLVSSSCVLVVRFLSPLMYSSSCVLSPCLVWCSLSVSPLIFVYRFLVCPLCSSVH